MLRVPRVVEVAEVDVGDALVRLVHNSHTDVTILLVLAVQRVPHNIVRGLRVKAGNAEDLVTSPVRGSSTSATRAAWGSKGPPWRASAPVPHDHLLAPLLVTRRPLKRSSFFTSLSCCSVLCWCHRSEGHRHSLLVPQKISSFQLFQLLWPQVSAKMATAAAWQQSSPAQMLLTNGSAARFALDQSQGSPSQEGGR